MADYLEVGMKLHAKYSDGEFYPAIVDQISWAKNRTKAPVKVSFVGYDESAWKSIAQLKSKWLPQQDVAVKASPKAKAKVWDYSGLEKGMKLKAEADGKYYSAEVVTVAKAKNRAGGPVKVHWVGYTAASDEWVGADRLRSKALTVKKPEDKQRKKPELSAEQLEVLQKSGKQTSERDAVIEKFKKELGNAVTPAAVMAFMQQYDMLVSGETGMISESTIAPATGLKDVSELPEPDTSKLAAIIEKTVILKLNGGLGTGMGLDKAKSLLEVMNGKNFLDFTADQIKNQRSEFKTKKLGFVLMNSFSTESDTRKALRKYKDLGAWNKMNMLQNKVPKILVEGFGPSTYDKNPSDEWCPPGHGDLYAALEGSGKLDQLIKEGKEYVFVSNSDNLGATLDLKLLQYFANEDAGFMMECCQRTDADKKGGHLAKKGDGLLLRELAQCPEADEKAFQDIGKHQFFNTNNLWFKLSDVKKVMSDKGGVMELPMIRNSKTVDPKDDSTAKVYQLETAMGAAIANFGARSRAVIVDRTRFAPVKKCDDLLNLRSDAYELTPDHRLQLIQSRKGVPPTVNLGDTYKKIGEFDTLCANGSPSMKDCTKLTLLPKKTKKIITLEKGVVFKGEVTVEVSDDGPGVLKAGEYTGTVKL